MKRTALALALRRSWTAADPAPGRLVILTVIPPAVTRPNAW
jgi:hypothetical protein